MISLWFSLLEAGPIQHPTTSDDYRFVWYSNQRPVPSVSLSVLEAVRPQPAAREGDYSRLELTGQLDLGPPKKPPYSGRKARGKQCDGIHHVCNKSLSLCRRRL